MLNICTNFVITVIAPLQTLCLFSIMLVMYNDVILYNIVHIYWVIVYLFGLMGASNIFVPYIQGVLLLYFLQCYINALL